ncbi:TPA_asm: P3 [Pueraria betacytorhabdovirus 1]|nr:TPA_asm: P3 [Pueraria betacytorhabdovirus 1]
MEHVPEKAKISKNTGRLSVQLKSEEVQFVSPKRVVGLNVFRMIRETSHYMIKLNEIMIKYTPYLTNISGRIIINLYDLRHADPKNKLVIHTSFTPSTNQYIVIFPNLVFHKNHPCDSILLEIFSVGLELQNNTNFGSIETTNRFLTFNRKISGGSATLDATPKLNYTRGDKLNPQQLESLVMKLGYMESEDDLKDKEDNRGRLISKENILDGETNWERHLSKMTSDLLNK